MRKPIVWISSLWISLMLLFATFEAYSWWTAESRATSIAVPAAAAIGFRLNDFKRPVVAGSHFWGTESFHWDAVAADGSSNRLTLLMSDERLCWSTIRMGEVRDHGCVVAKATVQ